MTNKLYISIKHYLKLFFENNFQSLSENYPGINLQVLYQNIEINLSSPYIGQEKIKLDSFLSQLLQGIPFEYVNNYKYFFNDRFYITTDVLIPRSETEILVELAIQLIKQKKYHRIWDIGTGSGAIAISIANNVSDPVHIIASDISSKALDIAQYNGFLTAFKRSKEVVLDFILSDLASDIDSKFDLIVSNPPYIKAVADRVTVHKNVKKFEPHVALFIDDSEYEVWYHKFFQDCNKCLDDNGTILLENHEDHILEISKIASKFGFSKCNIIQDYTNRDRFISLER